MQYHEQELNQSDDMRNKEKKLSTKVQSYFRMFVRKKKYKIIRNASIYIQKVARGYLARMLMKRNCDERYNYRNFRYFSNQAITIQRYFRGYHYRKYYIDFSVRKQFLIFLKDKNETFQKELKKIEQQEYEQKKVVEEQMARTEFEKLASNLHHLSSTKLQPGVYNKPYGNKDIVFDMDVESHLKGVFHNIDVTIQIIEFCYKIKTNKMIIFLISVVYAVQLGKQNVELAIDCGGAEAFYSNTGFQYKEDQYFYGNSRSVDYTYNEALDNGVIHTMNPKVYFTERHGEAFGYKIPLQPGQYTLILQFVELYFSGDNERQFDVYIGQLRVEQDFSIVLGTAKGAANDLYIRVEIKNNKVYFNELECTNGYVNGKLDLRFERGSADLPKIDGIIVVKGYEADDNERKNMIDNWEEIMKQQRKAQLEEKIHVDGDQLQQIEYEDENQQEINVFGFLFTPIGITITLLSIIFIFVVNMVDKGKKEVEVDTYEADQDEKEKLKEQKREQKNLNEKEKQVQQQQKQQNKDKKKDKKKQ
ncbi:hypothetical protein pb186bvf_008087 [Paramecium bursaria]